MFHWLAWMAAVAGMVFITISKAHYTIDVVVAYYVTTRLFWIYHTMANNMELKVKINLLFFCVQILIFYLNLRQVSLNYKKMNQK